MANFDGTNGDDIINGTSGDDTIDVSQGGTDTVNAGAGDDTIIGQNDTSMPGTIDGGAGFDVLRFIDPINGSSNNGFSSPDDFLTFSNGYSISNVERVEVIQSGVLTRLSINGSTSADVIDLSTEIANSYDVRTGSGNDTVTLGAFSGNASLALGSGIDIYNGSSSGTVFLFAGSGADIYNGGAAIESIDYFFSTVGVNVNLSTGIGSGGFAAGETYSLSLIHI